LGRAQQTPIGLSNADLSGADYIIAFNPIPGIFDPPVKTRYWQIPSFETGYPVAKDSLGLNIERLI
jgi:hypothetical protein